MDLATTNLINIIEFHHPAHKILYIYKQYWKPTNFKFYKYGITNSTTMDRIEKGSGSPPERRNTKPSDVKKNVNGEELCHHYGHYPNYDHHHPHNSPKSHPSHPCHRLDSSPGTP